MNLLDRQGRFQAPEPRRTSRRLPVILIVERRILMQSCVLRLLKRELAVEPDPGTRALAAELRKPHLGKSGSERKSAAPFESEVSPDTGAMPLSLPDRPSIAVLPFSNMSGDPQQDYFIDGIAEESIVALSRVRWFFVIARQSSFAYRDKGIDAKQIARELGVRYVLAGSVRRAGDQVRVSAQLMEGSSGNNVWARSYDRAAADIFAVQDEITQMIVGAIEPQLSRAERERARVKPRDSLDAWSTYQRGMFHLCRCTRDGSITRAPWGKPRTSIS